MFCGDKPLAIERRKIGQNQSAIVVIFTRFQPSTAAVCTAVIKSRAGKELSATGATKVTHLGVIGTLFIGHLLYCLGNDKVQVCIALAVTVRAHINRHAINRCSKVGAMVEIKATQKILVSFAGPTVLGHHHTRHQFEHTASALQGTKLNLIATHNTARCRYALANLVFARGNHFNFFNMRERRLRSKQQHKTKYLYRYEKKAFHKIKPVKHKQNHKLFVSVYENAFGRQRRVILLESL